MTRINSVNFGSIILKAPNLSKFYTHIGEMAAGNGRLEGKCALITGAARGIGLAFAKRYLEEGARVAIGDINFELAQKSAVKISKNRQNPVLVVHLDVSDQKSIDAAIQTVLTKFGQIDILINNAALFDMAPIAEITRESYERLFSVNVSGTLFMMQARNKGGKNGEKSECNNKIRHKN